MLESLMNIGKNILPEKKGPVQIIHEAFLRMELSREELNKLTAFNIADTLDDHQVRPYPTPKINTEIYINTRINGTQSRDDIKAKENGDWLFLMREIASQNAADMDLLLWARDICLKHEEKQRAFLINKLLDRHTKNEINTEYFLKATKVQKLDSIERKKKNYETR